MQCGAGKVADPDGNHARYHVFMSIYAVFKLECLKIKHKANHFALRAKLSIKATQQAYAELQKLKAA
jgi:hypothetical protein